jgi:hypothetical protein
MDYPFIENHNNYLVDYHIVYALVLLVLMVKNAGHVWGLDGWLSKHIFAERKGPLGWAFGYPLHRTLDMKTDAVTSRPLFTVAHHVRRDIAAV